VTNPSLYLLLAIALGGCDGCQGDEAAGSTDAGAAASGTAEAGPYCTLEITAGRGIRRVVEPQSGRSKKEMRKLLIVRGCTALCESDGEVGPKLKACVARCQTDIVADQVGIRFQCKE